MCNNMVHNLEIDKGAAHVRAVALLWACFDSQQSQKVLPDTFQRVKLAYSELIGLGVTHATQNPVHCAFLLVTGDDNQLHLQ